MLLLLLLCLINSFIILLLYILHSFAVVAVMFHQLLCHLLLNKFQSFVVVIIALVV